MNFQSVNPLNVQLNLVSGNLMPMTEDSTSFPTFWKICSVIRWLLELLQTCVMVWGCLVVPKEKALKDGLVAIVVFTEVAFIVARMHVREKLIQQLIRELNAFISLDDEMMQNIVRTTLKSIERPLKFYWMAGSVAIVIWSSAVYPLVLKKDHFYYVDFRMPVVYGKEPLSTSTFVLGNLVLTTYSVCIFTKKVSMDSYMINLVLLVTAQYRYIALKLSMIIQDRSLQSGNSEEKVDFSGTDGHVGKQIKKLCRHHNATVHTTALLRELLAINCSIIYVNSLFWFCGILIMVLAMSSTDPLEKAMIILYACGGLVELYILCFCVQQLFDAAFAVCVRLLGSTFGFEPRAVCFRCFATISVRFIRKEVPDRKEESTPSVEITDRAFQDEWYRLGTPVKRIFMLMIMSNKIQCKLSIFEDINLSLPSFMTIISQAYSIALLLLKTN